MLVIDLHAKNQHNICKRIEKSPENFHLCNLLSLRPVICEKSTKSKVHNIAKNQWSITKLKLDLSVMVIDLQAKNQLNICKHLEKKSGKLILWTDGWTD